MSLEATEGKGRVCHHKDAGYGNLDLGIFEITLPFVTWVIEKVINQKDFNRNFFGGSILTWQLSDLSAKNFGNCLTAVLDKGFVDHSWKISRDRTYFQIGLLDMWKISTWR